MAFITEADLGIDKEVNEDEVRKALMNVVKHSEAWEKHKKQHADADIVMVDFQRNENPHNTDVGDIYKPKIIEGLSAFCRCGGRFDFNREGDKDNSLNIAYTSNAEAATQYNQGSQGPVEYKR